MFTAAALIAAAQAIKVDTKYEMGDAPELSEGRGLHDPNHEFSNYNSIGGRGAREGVDGSRMENVLIDDDATDEDSKTRPMCRTGDMKDKSDEQGPAPFCCRVYEAPEFKGLHYDFCLYGEPKSEEWDTCLPSARDSQYWQADVYGWHDDVSSWWCGADVGIRLCAHEDSDRGTTADAAAGYEKAVECKAGDFNMRVIEDVGKKANMGAFDNTADSVWVFRTKMPKDQCDSECPTVGIVFDEKNCQG